MTMRKKYSKEFKLDVISQVLDQGFTQREAAKSLKINANMLGRWADAGGFQVVVAMGLKRENSTNGMD